MIAPGDEACCSSAEDVGEGNDNEVCIYKHNNADSEKEGQCSLGCLKFRNEDLYDRRN